MGAFTKATASRKAATVLGSFALLATSALVLSGCAATPTETEPVGDLTLKIGTALPQTGNLAFLGPPEEAGVALAVAEINEAAKGITVDSSSQANTVGTGKAVPRVDASKASRELKRTCSCPRDQTASPGDQRNRPWVMPRGP